MPLNEGTPHPAENSRAIAAIIGRANVKICASWKPTERAPTHVAARPGSVAEAAAVVRYARSRGMPVFPVSASTERTAAGRVGGIILNMERLKRIDEIDVRHLQCVAEPGVIAETLNEALLKAGLLFPPAHDVCGRERSLGGVIASQRDGARAMKYGSLRGWVDSVEAILPSGELIRAGGENGFRNLGFDLSGLFIGSRGRLGVITRMSLRLIHRPVSVWTLAAWFASHSAAACAAEAIIESPIYPSGLVFLDGATLEALGAYREERPPAGARSMLLVETEGDADAAGREIRAIDEICRDYSALRRKRSDDPAERDNLWEGYRSALRALEIFEFCAANLTLRMAPHEATHFLRCLDEIRPGPDGYFPACIGSIGGGELRIRFPWDPANETSRLPDEIPADLLKILRGANGVSALPRSLEHPGEEWLAPAEIEIVESIRRLFDPEGIMSPSPDGASEMDEPEGEEE